MSSRVLTLVTTSTFWKRFAQLNVGLMVLGFGVAVMLEAQVGLGPWPVFHEGVSLRLGLSFGRVMQLTGLLVIALGYLLGRIKPGLGTLLNMLLVGLWVDLFTARAWFPTADTVGWGLVQFVIGVVLVGLASGLYITAQLGAGPRDGLVLGLADTLKLSVRKVRSGLEGLVLVVGFLLGGSVGIGTLLFALLIGPLMQYSLRVFGQGKS